MKKTLAILAVLALTAPVFAGSVDITIDGSGNVILSNIVGDPPVGLALKVDAAAGSTTEDVGCASSYGSFFDVFIDFAHDNSVGYAIGDGHPVASDGAAGVPASVVDNGTDVTLSEAVIVLSMGELNNAADATGSITLAQIGLSAAGDVHLDVDNLRGGVVDTEGAQMTVNFTGGLGGQIYNVGVCSVGCACRGDIADDLGNPGPNGVVDFGDISLLITSVVNGGGSITPVPPSLLCADIADDLGNPVQGGNGVVDFGDISLLITSVVNAGGSTGCLP